MRRKKERMKKKLRKDDLYQLARFAVVGISNSIIDFGVLNLLLWLLPTTDAWRVLGYNSLAVLLAASNSFFWNKYWTFQQRSAITSQEVTRFVVLALSTTLMNDGLMLLLAHAFPRIMQTSLIGANALKLAAIVGTMSISFFGMRLWVFFHKKRVAPGETISPENEAQQLPAYDLVYDVNLMINGAIKPIHEIDTMILPAIPGGREDVSHV